MRLNDWQLAFEAFLLDEAVADPALVDVACRRPDAGCRYRSGDLPQRLPSATAGSAAQRLPDDLALAGRRGIRPAGQRLPAPISFGTLQPALAGQRLRRVRPRTSGAGSRVRRWLNWQRLSGPLRWPLMRPQARRSSIETMATLAPEEWPELRFKPTPSLQWFECRFNSLAHVACGERAKRFPCQRQPCDASDLPDLAQQGLVSHYRSLPSAEGEALNGVLNENWSFSELCAQSAVTYGEGAPLQAVTWLKQWVQDGLLERLQS